MKKTIEKFYCDICHEEAEVQTIAYPVLFHTEQDDGRSCQEYISTERVDFCQKCLRKALVVHGWGAQGLNVYKLEG